MPSRRCENPVLWVNSHSLLWGLPEELWEANAQFLDEVDCLLWRRPLAPFFNLKVEKFRGVIGKKNLQPLLDYHKSTEVLRQIGGYRPGRHARCYEWWILPAAYTPFALTTTTAITRHRKRRSIDTSTLTGDMWEQQELWNHITVDDSALESGGMREYGLFNIRSNREYASGDKDGRFQSTYVHLPRIQRRHLRIDGEEVYEADIRHSDFMWLLIHCYGLGQVDKNFTDDVMQSRLYGRALHENKDTLAKWPPTIKEIGMTDAERVKTAVIAMLNSKRPEDLHKDIRDWFYNTYPTIGAVLKAHIKDIGRFYKVARQWETEIVLPLAASLARDQQIATFTIHDCIASKASAIEEVVERFNAHASQYIQSRVPDCPYMPGLKVEACADKE